MIDSIAGSGFFIEKVVEPVPTEDFAKVKPEEYVQMMRRPRLLCKQVQKLAAEGMNGDR